jgi:phosphohistidine phosphatase
MIYLVHHADAVDSSVDAQRPLSTAGREDVARLAGELAGRGVRPAAIWHSGKLRARQTADAIRSACNPSAEMTAIRGLQPADPPEWIRDRLLYEARDVMIVGHFPSLPRILHTLIIGSDDGSSEDFPLHGVVALTPLDDRWVVQWKLTAGA